MYRYSPRLGTIGKLLKLSPRFVIPYSRRVLQKITVADGRIARQTDHLHRLGAEFEQDRHRISRSERLCVDSDPRPPDRSVGMEADLGVAEHQSRRYFRALESA